MSGSATDGIFQPLEADDPQMVAGYRLAARLGSGGMGKVYLSHTPGGRPVAIKVIRPEFAEDAEFRRRFKQEVQSAQRVQGLFTAPVIDADADGPVPWLATAYVPGPTVAAAVAEHGALPARTVLMLAAGIAEALQVIHGAGIVHRDLKPSNVLLASDGPRVIDFGIARAADATSLTASGVAIGTPSFMAPEQAAGGRIGPATDIFALGQVAAYAALGAPAYGEGPSHGVLYRIVHEEPRLTGLPEELRPLVERCLAKDAADRASLAEVLELCRAADGQTQLRRPEDWLPGGVAAGITSRVGIVPGPVGGPVGGPAGGQAGGPAGGPAGGQAGGPAGGQAGGPAGGPLPTVPAQGAATPPPTVPAQDAATPPPTAPATAPAPAAAPATAPAGAVPTAAAAPGVPPMPAGAPGASGATPPPMPAAAPAAAAVAPAAVAPYATPTQAGPAHQQTAPAHPAAGAHPTPPPSAPGTYPTPPPSAPGTYPTPPPSAPGTYPTPPPVAHHTPPPAHHTPPPVNHTPPPVNPYQTPYPGSGTGGYAVPTPVPAPAPRSSDAKRAGIVLGSIFGGLVLLLGGCAALANLAGKDDDNAARRTGGSSAASSGGGSASGSRNPSAGGSTRPRTDPKPATYANFEFPAGYHIELGDDPLTPRDSQFSDDLNFSCGSSDGCKFTSYVTKMVLLDSAEKGSLDTCRKATRFTNQILLETLSRGDQICLRTKSGNIALVTYRGMSGQDDPSTHSTVDVTVWRGALEPETD
ncbi:protein kinase [Streptomyces sp. NPDC101118]|uniref:serine/threonine-protein kinase n=1 Tax=Streptomyces sp. NPDC101118 TaxID=3366109 RepID=UPI003822A4AD